MGTEISGWVEVRPIGTRDFWEAAINIATFVSRSYDAFGCLFGVRNMANFEPVAAGRGIPSNASDLVRDLVARDGDDVHDPSWLGWDEIVGIDWDETARAPHESYTRYLRGPEGSLIWTGRAAIWRWEMEKAGSWVDVSDKHVSLQDGDVEHEGFVYRREVMTRQQAVINQMPWLRLFQHASLMAVDYGLANVRVVVWFTS